jgi:hypothetical protein
MWWVTTVILAFEKQRQKDYKFNTSLGYTVSLRDSLDYTVRPCQKKKKKKKVKGFWSPSHFPKVLGARTHPLFGPVSMWGYEAKTPLLLGTLGFRQF